MATDPPDPAYIQKNIQSLSAIGGIYDLLAIEVERQHIEILTPYRLATGAKSAVELLRARDERNQQILNPTTRIEETNAEDDH